MSDKKRGKLNLGKIIAAVLIIVLILGVVGFCYKFTNGFKTDFASFYVECGDKTVTTEASGFNFDKGKAESLKVGRPLDFANKEDIKYTVRVFPNVTEDTDFEFTVKEYPSGVIICSSGVTEYKINFSEVGELTEYFEIVRDGKIFTLKTEDTLNDMLTRRYCTYSPVRVISGLPDIDGTRDYFRLEVTDEDGGAIVNLTFNVIISATGLKIAPDNFVAG